jgi:hypothetical protein
MRLVDLLSSGRKHNHIFCNLDLIE